jgi:hypothetical protein
MRQILARVLALNLLKVEQYFLYNKSQCIIQEQLYNELTQLKLLCDITGNYGQKSVAI